MPGPERKAESGNPNPPTADRLPPTACRLVRAIDELVSNGLASREWSEIGWLLVYCQWCNRFTGSGCGAFDGGEDRTDLLNMLTDCGRWCPDWPNLFATP